MLKQLPTLLLSVTIISIAFTNQALAQDCPRGSSKVPIKGKVFNNQLPTGQTLGVAYLKLSHEARRLFDILHILHGNRERLECGIMGNLTYSDPTDPLRVDFQHTLSCQDHSELWLHTSGRLSPWKSCPNSQNPAFSFEEVSTPITNASNKGLFADVTGGEIKVKGTINCKSEVDMKFKGYVCSSSRSRW